jgi:hypothetical protein
LGEAVCDGHLKSICLRIFPATPRTSEIVDLKAGLREIPHRDILSSKSHRIVSNRIGIKAILTERGALRTGRSFRGCAEHSVLVNTGTAKPNS